MAKSISSTGDNINQLVESNKSKFKGMEVKGKTLGVIGLGAIGMMVANNAVDLGVNVLARTISTQKDKPLKESSAKKILQGLVDVAG